MKNPRTCPKCESILVCWNWFTPATPEILGPWHHECWECGNMFPTDNEVTDGIPYKALKPLRTLLDQGKPVVYSKQMRILYGEG